MCQPPSNNLCIVQMEEGNFKAGTINSGGIYKWLIQDGSVRNVPLHYLGVHIWDTDETNEIFKSPTFKFYINGKKLLLTELFGTNLAHRLRGRLEVSEDRELRFLYLRTVWHSRTYY